TLKEGTRADADYIDYLKETVGAAEPAFVYFTREEAQGGFDSVTVNVMGEDFTVLDELAQKLAGKMSEQEGISDAVLRYKQPRPERKLVVARDKAEGAGLSPGSVGENLRLAIQGGVATKFLENNREVDVRVRYNERFRADLDSLEHYMLQGSHGYVPLFAVAGLEEGTIPVKIYRRDKKRMLSFSVRPGDIDLDEAIEKIEALRAEPLPEDYRIEYGHEFRRLIESRRRTYGMLLAVLLLAYMFLATWTESLTQPLRILLILPPPLSAALLALYIFDVDMSVQMIVGLLLLCGLLFVQLSYARLTDGRAPYWRSAVVAMALFYLPFGLVSGEGAEMTRGIAIVLSVGALTGVITTPMVERITRSRRMRIALKRMGVQISDRLRRVGERLWPSDTLRK
ncbi:MAG: efflux RND transporter permease subunit, partial [Leptospiraceae bacterium]|nr:efflux RND transporter permease subunit [Leptospiraceae bacterium]